MSMPLYSQSVIIFKINILSVSSICIPHSGTLPQHTHFSGLSDQEVTSVVNCSLCRGAGHEIKLLLVISVQLLPPWPLVVCVPERDIRLPSEHALPVCVREGEMLCVRSTASDCFIFFLN